MSDGRLVTKTDIISYSRCPYAFSLIDKGEVDLSMLSPMLSAQLTAGEAFEKSVTRDLEKLPPGISVAEAMKLNITVFGVPTLVNGRRELCGRPDGIDPRKGAMIPIEIKNHRRVSHSDRLELAFYWNLLEPYRKRFSAKPTGILVLTGGGVDKRIETPLTDELFDEVDELIDGVRTARNEGVIPQYCRCAVCATRPEVLASAAGDLALLQGIKQKRREVLKRSGIATHDDLLAASDEKIRAALAAGKHYVNVREFTAWKAHALAFREQRTVCFEAQPFQASSFISVDLEYHSDDDYPLSAVWLVGFEIVQGDSSVSLSQHWIDNPGDYRRALQALDSALQAYPGLPILTWAGNTAEVPHLRAGAEALELHTLLAAIQSRHFDLYAITERSFRFPFPGLGLKELARHVGFSAESPVSGGFEADFLHYRYTKAKDEEKANLKETLLTYNREDVQALSMIATTLFRTSRDPDHLTKHSISRDPSPR